MDSKPIEHVASLYYQLHSCTAFSTTKDENVLGLWLLKEV